MADIKTLIEQTYYAFNKRDIDGALALMVQDVSWPKAFEGGKIVGKEEIRAYWTRQWAEFDPHVEPLAIGEEDGGRVRARVHQLVKNLDGDVVSDTAVLHVFNLDNGLIAAMDLGADADTTGPSTGGAYSSGNPAASRTALVLGATGGIGGETASALQRHGWSVRALVRDTAKASAARGPLSGVEWRRGDALDPTAVTDAARGAALVVHAVNPPGYRNWDRTVLPMIDNSIAAARATGARILLPGTIYNYGPDAFPLLTEGSPQHPVTRKGKIRVELERRLRAAGEQGVQTLVLRAGDFFGPRAGNNWFSQGLVKTGRPVRAISYPGAPGVGHSWAYLPDVAETFARLVDRQLSGGFETFHFEGHWDADGTAVVAAIQRAVSPRNVKVRALPWVLLRLAAPFNETMRELLEMKPLWMTPVRLDNHKLLHVLDAEPRTPLDQAVTTTLRGIGAL